MRIFVAWSSPDFVRELEQRLQADKPDELRQQQQRLDLADQLWRSWCQANDGSILECGRGQGMLEIPTVKLDELPSLQQQYANSIESNVCVGVGTKTFEAKRAMEVSELRGSDDIILYSEEVEQEYKESTNKEDILVKGEFGGPSQAPTQVAPAAPETEASEHSQAEGARLVAAQEASGAPAPAEDTHAAQDLEEHFHAHASQQEAKDQAQQDDSEKEKAALKTAVASILTKVKASSASIGMLKQADPHAYEAVMGLVQSVIAMAHSLSDKEPMKKSEIGPLQKSLKTIPVGQPQTSSNPNVTKYDYSHTLSEPAKASGYTVTVQTKKIDDPEASHEIEAWVHHGDKSVGSVRGTLGKAPYRPGEIEITHSYLDPNHRGQGLGNAAYESLMAHGMNQHQMVHVKGDEHSTSAGRVHRSLAEKHGMDYDHLYDEPDDEGQDYDANHSGYGYALKQELAMEKGALPMPKSPGKTRHNVVLPVGSVKTGGPTGNAHGEVGKIKVEHGNGKTSWVQARAGQVTAVADRHAKPVLGHASHPLSSRNPSGT